MKAANNVTPDALIQRLMVEARRSAEQDRRSVERWPFFRPVSIHLDGHCFSAFSRDISAAAVGLLHHMALPAREMEITIPFDGGQPARLSVRIGRCESCGAGWYTSYADFLDTRG
jgi:hypothetical protein